MKTLILKCRFCQKQTGTYDYPDSVADLGIADVRCSDCELLHGSYTKMEQDFHGTHKDFISIMKKAEYKRAKFDIEMAKLIEPILGKSSLKIKKNRGIIKHK